MVTKVGLDEFPWSKGQDIEEGEYIEKYPQTRMFESLYKEMSFRISLEDPKTEEGRDRLYEEILFHTHLDPKNDHPLVVRDIRMIQSLHHDEAYVLGVIIDCSSDSCFANTLRFLQDQLEKGQDDNLSMNQLSIGDDKIDVYRYDMGSFAVSWSTFAGDTSADDATSFFISYVASEEDIHPDLLLALEDESLGEYE